VAHKVSCIVGIIGIIRAPQAKILLGIDSIIQVLYSRIIGIIGIIGNIRSQDNIAEGTV
jgi:hypothetical protein